MSDTEPGRLGAPIVDFCQREGCDQPLPDGHHPTRKYCDEHQPKQSKKQTDKAPKSVTVNVKIPNVPKSKKKGPEQQVIEGATSLLSLIGLGLNMAGDAECSAVIVASAPNIAAQLGEVAKYHPGIAKAFAMGQISGEAGAWIGLGIAVAPVIIAVLVHHDLLPASIAEKIGGVAAMLGAMATTESDPEPAQADEAPESVANAA